MNELVIRTTAERLAAVQQELGTAWIGDEKGQLISGFLDDLAAAQPVPAPEPPAEPAAAERELSPEQARQALERFFLGRKVGR